jgi:hypothetical protein
MDSDNSILRRATLLWDHGHFLATNIDHEQTSLYRYKDKLYVIWYSPKNVLEKVEEVDVETAKKMFKKFN